MALVASIYLIINIKKMKNFFLITLCLLLTMSISACGKKTITEKAIEKTIEESMGGQANVNLDDESVTIETEEGMMQVGSNTELPADWPEDIYIIDGNITSASSHANGIFNVSIETDQSTSDVQAKYEEELKKAGWTMTMTFVVEGNVMLGAKKDDRSVSITIGDDEGKTSIVIGTSKN